MINILSIFPDVNDATCFYRGLGPLNHLQQNNSEIKFTIMPNEDPWHVYRQSDLLFIQRPFSPQHIIAMEQAHKCGRKVWVDYDDDYFGIEIDNPVYYFYKDAAQKDRMKQIARLADVITTSTKHLSKVYSQYNKNVITVPNAIDEQMFNWRNPSPERKKKILWRGTQIHAKALRKFSSVITAVAHDNPEWEWCFMGEHPWELLESIGEQATYQPHISNLPNYFSFIHNFNHSLQLVVSIENSFNFSKSNVSWLEASFSGAATVSPNWEEWQVPGIYHYKNEDYFCERMQQAMNSYSDNFETANKAWDYIKENLLLSTINKQRLEIIKSII